MSTNMQESFADLFEASLTRQEMRQGEVITAEIVRIDQNFVVVNAGLKSESYIDRDEFLNDQGDLEVQVGDFVQVAIDSLRTASAKPASRANAPSVSRPGTTWRTRSTTVPWLPARSPARSRVV